MMLKDKYAFLKKELQSKVTGGRRHNLFPGTPPLRGFQPNRATVRNTSGVATGSPKNSKYAGICSNSMSLPT
jgi:hypothetical protein